jgi:anti-anti-sigma regulatory factor
VVLVDLSHTEFVDCAGLAPLVVACTSVNGEAIWSSTHPPGRSPRSSNAPSWTR